MARAADDPPCFGFFRAEPQTPTTPQGNDPTAILDRALAEAERRDSGRSSVASSERGRASTPRVAATPSTRPPKRTSLIVCYLSQDGLCARGPAAAPLLSGTSELALLYASVLGSAAAYAIFFYNASRGNLTKLSSLTFLTPVFAAAFGWAVLGETLSGDQLLGAVVTLAGVLLVTGAGGEDGEGDAGGQGDAGGEGDALDL